MASTNGETVQARVLCPEKLSSDGLALLRKNLIVDERQGLTPEQLISIIPDYDALLVRSETKVTNDLLQAARKLKVVARAGVGVDNVDVPAATRLGIVVVNSPSGNIQAAAEHTIALLMSMARNIPDACASLKGGRWERSRLVGVEVKGKTLGVVGLGKVGLIVARMARGLGMNVVAADPYAAPSVAAAANVELVETLSELLPVVDFLTIHTPMLAATRGMLSTSELNSMRRGARILNVARGGIIDEEALLAALDSGHIAGAAIDVFTSEPPHKDAKSSAARLVQHPKCIATPHLGASTVEAQENVSIDVCEQVLQVLAGDLPRSAVNAPIILPAEYKTLQPFVRLVEKMGSLYTQHFTSPTQPLHQRNMNTFDLIYEGEIANMSSTKPLFAALIKGLTLPISDAEGFNVNIVNAEMVAKERGIFVNEQKSRDPSTLAYSSLVTLIARSASRAPSLTRHPSALEGLSLSSNVASDQQAQLASKQHIISGYCSDNSPVISRLDRFATSFAPEGTLLICHNYDSPGKIGVVGSILGREGVNINFMSVAPATFSAGLAPTGSSSVKDFAPNPPAPKETTEALMILGVDKEVGDGVKRELIGAKGVLNVSSVTL
ncbi:D-3-phosphoglycerate dehydrogenase [Cladophialophora psammophila CBS 110553]|uniref:D-3-phosphoglycerate dehydrogenase n=1 Tax=Cladophialophora psammophila CBS 110553 TaxID=1182543 RepID=W9XGG2_9EURO|nr:D-3-phosphoglycerate dehydrogenase [Cladophialophora psammophila CBS 110553]EXJ76415.1 D-3-phosphoglycerate dehydrogenase [Cladophialophora psammophila CBS 110553]